MSFLLKQLINSAFNSSYQIVYLIYQPEGTEGGWKGEVAFLSVIHTENVCYLVCMFVHVFLGHHWELRFETCNGSIQGADLGCDGVSFLNIELVKATQSIFILRTYIFSGKLRPIDRGWHIVDPS